MLSKLNMFYGPTNAAVIFGEIERCGGGHIVKYQLTEEGYSTNLMYLAKSKFIKRITVEYKCVDCHSVSRVKLYKHLDSGLYIECGCGEKCEPTVKTLDNNEE